MNTILLEPTDVLFFRDGRPMGGASAGHGAAWPLPTVVNHAFHAALHRAGDVFKDAHLHRRGRSGIYEESRDRRFGSLVTAGPFPSAPMVQTTLGSFLARRMPMTVAAQFCTPSKRMPRQVFPPRANAQ